jgi:hypothetical protein
VRPTLTARGPGHECHSAFQRAAGCRHRRSFPEPADRLAAELERVLLRKPRRGAPADAVPGGRVDEWVDYDHTLWVRYYDGPTFLGDRADMDFNEGRPGACVVCIDGHQFSDGRVERHINVFIGDECGIDSATARQVAAASIEAADALDAVDTQRVSVGGVTR